MTLRLAALLLVSSCATLRQLTPEGPVMSLEERAAWGPWSPSGARYRDGPSIGVPVMPVQVWGLSYEVDLVIRSTHPDFDMHEYARITTPEGPLWLMKDARCERDVPDGPCARLVQTIVADLDDVDTILPEAPVPRRRSAVSVTDHSTDTHLDLSLGYTNIDGAPVTVHVRAKHPTTLLAERNGNTMGHSEDSLLAVLDLSRRTLGRATLTIDGERQRLKTLAGVPIVAALVQTQGGFSVGEFTVEAEADGVRTRHGEVAQDWVLVPTSGGMELAQHGRLRTLRYQFLEVDGSLELVEASVSQYASAGPGVVVRFEPALPDARRVFDGRQVSRWVVEVGGLAHAMGTVDCWWDRGVFRTELVATAPSWAAVRPMTGEVSVAQGVATVRIVRD